MDKETERLFVFSREWFN